MAARNDDRLACRRAIEALRNGVPNREAVERLGCSQPGAETAFTRLLDRATDAGDPPGSPPGMLVSGDFGAGKSHLLAYLERLALSRRFVCSKVTISKETPLYDLGKVFKSAVEKARVPDRHGRLIQELASTMDWKGDASESFSGWADTAASKGLISRIFPASLLVYRRLDDLELEGRIESFWAGDRIKVSEVKGGLRRIGKGRDWAFRAPKAADLPLQRLRFVIELIKAAGYRGWVVLLDEIELIGSYSLLQRGRSYAELTRWLGRAVGEACPGLIAAGTVTQDFASVNISPDGRKKDRDYVAHKLKNSTRYAGIAGRAETGMRVLERDCIRLNPPTEDDVRATVGRLREIYSRAYQWEAPPLEGRTGGVGSQARMRYKVRSSINEWDLLRIYPDSRPATVVDVYDPTYGEDPELERESRGDAEDT